MFKRSVKCDLDSSTTSDSIYQIGELNIPRNSTVEKAFVVDNHVTEYLDSNGVNNFRVNLLSTDDLVTYTNINITKHNDIKAQKNVNNVADILFVNVPKHDINYDKLNICVDYDKLNELIKTTRIDTSYKYLINIYDNYGIFNMIRKYEINNTTT
jgi:hypothetical protein